MHAYFLYVYVCVCVCVCVHLRVIFCMWHVHVFCVLYWVFVCICMLDWRRDLVPSWSRLGWKFPGVPASLFVHKPSIERPHKHVKVAKHLDNIDKKIIIRNIFFYINAIFSNVKTNIFLAFKHTKQKQISRTFVAIPNMPSGGQTMKHQSKVLLLSILCFTHFHLLALINADNHISANS